MKRRWVIRVFSVGLLLLCVGGWGWSYQGEYGINHQGRDLWQVMLGHGEIYLLFDFLEDPSMKVRRAWYWGVVETPHHISYGSWLCGFGVSNPHETNERWMALPFWFPTTLSAALLWLVWRKTQPPVKGRTFPVEAKQPNLNM